MGLGDIDPSTSSSTSGSSTSSGSSSSGSSSGVVSRETLSGVGPGDFPVDVAKTPELIIRETDDGYEDIWYPETPTVEVTYDWYGSFDYDRRADEVRIIWSKDTFELLAHRVDRVHSVDLRDAIRDDPERGLELIRAAANEDINAEFSRSEKCPVCRTEIDARYDDYETVDGRRVCTSHTAEEMADADLL